MRRRALTSSTTADTVSEIHSAPLSVCSFTYSPRVERARRTLEELPKFMHPRDWPVQSPCAMPPITSELFCNIARHLEPHLPVIVRSSAAKGRGGDNKGESSTTAQRETGQEAREGEQVPRKGRLDTLHRQNERCCSLEEDWSRFGNVAPPDRRSLATVRPQSARCSLPPPNTGMHLGALHIQPDSGTCTVSDHLDREPRPESALRRASTPDSTCFVLNPPVSALQLICNAILPYKYAQMQPLSMPTTLCGRAAKGKAN